MAVRMKSVRFAKKPSLTSRSIPPRSTSPTLMVIFSLLSALAISFNLVISSSYRHLPTILPPSRRLYDPALRGLSATRFLAAEASHAMQPPSGLDGRGRTAMTAGPRPHRRPRGHPERPGLAGFAPSLRNGRGSTPLASARVPCRPCFAPTAAVRRRRGLTTPAVHCTKQATQTLLLTAKGERLTPPTRDA